MSTTHGATEATPDSALFSVIIPTLQRSPVLWQMIQKYETHPLVGEVLIINNAQKPLTGMPPKVRVLQQDRNIYVNPAWNLGAAEAVYPYLAIVNDDVAFHDEAITHAARVLKRGLFSIVGPDRSCFVATDSPRPVSHRFGVRTPWVFGNFMCLRRQDYVPVPETMKIWGGDDWLILNQSRPTAVLVHTRFVTEMGTTSGSAEFQAMHAHERLVWQEVRASIDRPWWIPIADALGRFRLARHNVLRHLGVRKG